MREYDCSGHYSDLMRVPSGHFKLSGVKSWDGDKIKGDTVSEQFHKIMVHLSRSLNEAGIMIKDITFVSVFLSDLSLYNELNDVYSQYFPHKPCRAVIGAQLRSGALVEIVVEGWSND